MNCKKVCGKCGYCKAFTKKVTQVYSRGGTELEAHSPLDAFTVKA